MGKGVQLAIVALLVVIALALIVPQIPEKQTQAEKTQQALDELRDSVDEYKRAKARAKQ